MKIAVTVAGQTEPLILDDANPRTTPPIVHAGGVNRAVSPSLVSIGDYVVVCEPHSGRDEMRTATMHRIETIILLKEDE